MKYIYIKNNISGNFVECRQKFDTNLFNNIGYTFEDYVNGKWVLLDRDRKSVV